MLIIQHVWCWLYSITALPQNKHWTKKDESHLDSNSIWTNNEPNVYETGPGSHITNVAGRMIQTVGRFSTDFYMLGREGRGGSDAAHMRPALSEDQVPWHKY